MDTDRNSVNQNRATIVDGGISTPADGTVTDRTAADRAAARVVVDGETVRPVTPEPSLGQLFADLSSDFSRLARQEIQLARAETMQSVKKATGSAAMIGAGGAVAYAGVLLLLAAATIALGALFDSYALAALIVGAIVLVIGGVLIASGQAALKRTSFVPEQTIQTIEDDAKFVKEKVSRD